MTKKTLPTETVIDDLAGSPFFKRRAQAETSYKEEEQETKPANELPATSIPVAPDPSPAVPPVTNPERANDRTTERVNGRTGERVTPVRRIMTRNSFEIYEDQMQSLRTLSYREKLAGKLGSMSQMVREAIDDYLRKSS